MFSFSETDCRENLFPFTLTRHTADIRTGIFTTRERWELAAEYFPDLHLPDKIPANLIPGPGFFRSIAAQGYGKAFTLPSLFKIFYYPWELPVINSWAIEQDFALVILKKFLLKKELLLSTAI
jgi:hypothetical protein